jgi:hypothetical protein
VSLQLWSGVRGIRALQRAGKQIKPADGANANGERLLGLLGVVNYHDGPHGRRTLIVRSRYLGVCDPLPVYGEKTKYHADNDENDGTTDKSIE